MSRKYKFHNRSRTLDIVERQRGGYTKGKWVYVERKVAVPNNIVKLNVRISMNSSAGGTVYFDNLSIRKVNPEQDIEIVEENNYYPFGLKHKGYNNVINGEHYPYGYNGKEENDELGLEWLDFGARNYDASLGRWMNLDPLAELMRRHSPYNYAFDNPVYYIDPDGMAPEGSDWIDNKDGTWTAEAGDSAATLSEDANISFDEANKIVQEQHGKNYVDTNGVEKSAIDPGDSVRVSDSSIETNSENSNLNNDPDLNDANKNSSDPSNNSVDNSFLDDANTALTAVGNVKLGQEALIRTVSNSADDLAPAVNQYFSWTGRVLGFLSLSVNYSQYKQAKNNNDALGQKRAKAEGLSNALMSTGNPVLTAAGVGGQISLLLNPTMSDPKTPKSYNYNNHCFVKGTKIKLANGNQINIEDIKAGQEIKSVNMDKIEVENDTVIEIKEEPTLQNKIIIILIDGNKIATSPSHPFYILQKGWSTFENKTQPEYGKYKKGDKVLFLENNELIKKEIAKIINTNKWVPMYNIKSVNKNNTFFANSILVHNKYLD